VIQAAAQRALAAGVRVSDCLELIAGFRARHPDLPVGILTYANIVTARVGFMHDAAAAGADSLLIADVPTLEAERYAREMEQAGIEPVLIAAANTPDPALRRIASLSKAYTYCVSRAGITGTHSGGQFDPALVERLSAEGAPPAVFGFGISKPEHVRAALQTGAKGVICGSAIVDLASRQGDVTGFVQSLKAVTRNDSAAE
jgi:tryptophan synthase alpha chain